MSSQERVRLILDLWQRGWSYRSIAAELKSEDAPTKHNRCWRGVAALLAECPDNIGNYYVTIAAQLLIEAIATGSFDVQR